ncbi:MAG: recombination regulator RecX [Marinobacterium sp.]|nr:recombination regulator RecX [Marinobacterium sp.]
MTDLQAQRSEIRNRIFRLLGRREYSLKELHQKLGVGHPSAMIDEVLTQMVAEGYQSDRRFCEVYLRNRVGQYYGLNRVRQDMRQKGIAASMLTEVLEEQAPDWYELALQARLRRFPEPDRTDRKQGAKILRHLLQRGFNMDEARYALDTDPEDSW